MRSLGNWASRLYTPSMSFTITRSLYTWCTHWSQDKSHENSQTDTRTRSNLSLSSLYYFYTRAGGVPLHCVSIFTRYIQVSIS